MEVYFGIAAIYWAACTAAALLVGGPLYLTGTRDSKRERIGSRIMIGSMFALVAGGIFAVAAIGMALIRHRMF